jgi:hypothetical protein
MHFAGGGRTGNEKHLERRAEVSHNCRSNPESKPDSHQDEWGKPLGELGEGKRENHIRYDKGRTQEARLGRVESKFCLQCRKHTGDNTSIYVVEHVDKDEMQQELHGRKGKTESHINSDSKFTIRLGGGAESFAAQLVALVPSWLRAASSAFLPLRPLLTVIIALFRFNFVSPYLVPHLFVVSR